MGKVYDIFAGPDDVPYLVAWADNTARTTPLAIQDNGTPEYPVTRHVNADRPTDRYVGTFEVRPEDATPMGNGRFVFNAR